MRLILCLLSLALLSACTMEEKKGILVSAEPGTPMDESDLRQHCDLGDAAACALASLKDTPLPSPRYSVVQGLAPSDRAVFAALVPKDRYISWFLYDPETMLLTKLFLVRPYTRGDSRWALQRLDIRGLTPGREYELLAGDSEGRLLDDRKFRTFSPDENKLKIAIVGGWRFASPVERPGLISGTLAGNPQLLIFAGSAFDETLPPQLLNASSQHVIADYFFEREAQARATFGFGLSRTLVPTLDLWNDDEFGQPDGDRSFKPRDQAREQLELFFPHWADDGAVIAGPGVSMLLNFRHATLFLGDDLSFRKAPTPSDPVCQKNKAGREVCKPGKPTPAPPGTRYGGLEKTWASEHAAKAPNPVWIFSGGRTLTPFRDEWTDLPALNDPSLTHAPSGSWSATLEDDGKGNLQLNGGAHFTPHD